jgi:pyruvate formate lyase activating enzyme
MKIVCETCPHACALEPGQLGLCGARENAGGEVKCASYGRVSALALDPIEKKPLMRFMPGSRILSVGGFGCNMRCPFCQNHEISMERPGEDAPYVAPEALVERARGIPGNIGLAYTYNEPLVSWEYVRDCAKLIHAADMKNVLVTNGMANLPVLEEILPHMDAMNVDLKGFTPESYKRLGGDFETARRFIARAAGGCHVEITTLVVPGRNDSEAEMKEEAEWIASVDPEIPLHITRYFPMYRENTPPTPARTIGRLVEIAREKLKYVYAGNMP